ncbi:MAG: response regulator transcription factor [Anaerolineales bacterium]|nr:response regulator transcription factor [Anaerolineales bacterium]
MSDTSILVVEDEPSIAEVVSLYLKRAGFRVRVLPDGDAALVEMERQMPDLVVLDIMLPGMDGFDITRWIRDRSDAPIIMLTARRGEVDRIAGLEMGADDYVVKPFSPQELVSRVRAVLRRSAGIRSSSGPPIDYGDIHIDPTTRIVTVRSDEKNLTAKEFDILWELASHPRQVLTRHQLLDRVWGHAEYIDPSTVTVFIRRIRDKIEEDSSNPRHLITVWGVGYRFEP